MSARSAATLALLCVALGAPAAHARITDTRAESIEQWDGWSLLRRAWREIEIDLDLSARFGRTDGAPSLSVAPVVAAISSRFGRRWHPITRRRQIHRGVDFAAPRGTPVMAAGAGTVIKARRSGYYGKLVIIDHGDGVETRYAHLHRIDVRAGDTVAAGQILGTVGSTGRVTGPHLHFEVYRDGAAIDPMQALTPGTLAVLKLQSWLSRRARAHRRSLAI